TGLFKLKNILPEGMVFPLDFGFVPATLAEDGDPLDIMVMSDLALFPGALVDVRLIGVIEARQTEQGRTARNDRLLAVAAVSRRYAQFRAPGDLPPEMLHQLVHFWIDKDALEGKLFEPLGVGDAARAITRLREAAAAFVKAEQ
ncbi:MAG: inorganic diphosphatase, partial [Caulobacteraceae bacterium]